MKHIIFLYLILIRLKLDYFLYYLPYLLILASIATIYTVIINNMFNNIAALGSAQKYN